jgi:hypothetical protein
MRPKDSRACERIFSVSLFSTSGGDFFCRVVRLLSLPLFAQAQRARAYREGDRREHTGVATARTPLRGIGRFLLCFFFLVLFDIQVFLIHSRILIDAYAGVAGAEFLRVVDAVQRVGEAVYPGFSSYKVDMFSWMLQFP